MRKESTPKDRRIGVGLYYDTVGEKNAVQKFLTAEGRTASSYIKYLIEQAMISEFNGHGKSGKIVVGKPVDISFIQGK